MLSELLNVQGEGSMFWRQEGEWGGGRAQKEVNMVSSSVGKGQSLVPAGLRPECCLGWMELTDTVMGQESQLIQVRSSVFSP